MNTELDNKASDDTSNQNYAQDKTSSKPPSEGSNP